MQAHPRLYLSGAQKRKLKKERDEANKRKLGAFIEKCQLDVTTQVPSACKVIKIDPDCPLEDSLFSVGPEIELKTVIKYNKKQSIVYFEKPPDVSKISLSNRLNVSLTYPTDRGHHPINNLDPDLKLAIINYGPCKPQGPFPKDDKNRCFSLEYYWKKTPNGQKVPRHWLCYSQKLDCAYCEPCWLFAEKLILSNNSAWARGVNDWQGLSKKLKDHEASQTHILSCITYGSWKNSTAVGTLQQPHWKERISLWRDVLRRVVEISSILSTSSVALRRPDLFDISKSKAGTSSSLIEALSQTDVLLSNLFDKNKDRIESCLTPEIQTELVTALSSEIKKTLVSEIQEAQFYSIILGSAGSLDREEISLVFRYITTEYCDEVPTDLKICESFVGYFPVLNKPQETVCEIVEFIEKKGFSFNKCRGISYDGVKYVNEICGKLQGVIEKIELNATYVHCADHNLNTVLMDAVQIPEIELYYKYVQRIYKYFRKHPTRWNLLEKLHVTINLLQESDCSSVNLPKWSSSYDVIIAVVRNYSGFMKALNYTLLTSQTTDEIEEAKSISEYMGTFEFILISVIQLKILEATHFLSECLHSSDVDLAKTSEIMDETQDALVLFRSQYVEVLNEAEALADSWGTPSYFEGKKARQSLDVVQDKRLEDPQLWFKVKVFEANLDSILAQLGKRVESMQQVARNFDFLLPSRLADMNERDLLVCSSDLAGSYPDDLSLDFPSQMLSFRNVLVNTQDNMRTGSVYDLAKLLIVQYSTLLPSLPDVSVALRLFLTLPVTLASPNSHFSKFNMIRNYFSSSLVNTGLPSLSVIGIEIEKARSLDISKVVYEIAKKSARSNKTL